MANKPSFDLGGIVNNLKSMVNPAGGTPNADPNDVLGVQLADLSKLVAEVKARHDEYSKVMSKDLSKINDLFKGVYASLEAIRQVAEEPIKEEASTAKAPLGPEEIPAEEPIIEEDVEVSSAEASENKPDKEA